MPNDPFYMSPKWRRLRAAALERDHGVCVVPGCKKRASHVDHIVDRKDGGPDTLANLRSLCREHNNQIMQDASGKRRSGGKLTVRGCDARGNPLDPNHPWHA